MSKSYICKDCAKTYEAKPKAGVCTMHTGHCSYCDDIVPKTLTPVRDFILKKDTPPYKYWLGPKED